MVSSISSSMSNPFQLLRCFSGVVISGTFIITFELDLLLPLWCSIFSMLEACCNILSHETLISLWMCSFTSSLVLGLVIIQGFSMTPCRVFDVVYYASLVSIVWMLQFLDNILYDIWMLSSHLRVLDNIIWAFRYHLVLCLQSPIVGHSRLFDDLLKTFCGPLDIIFFYLFYVWELDTQGLLMISWPWRRL